MMRKFYQTAILTLLAGAAVAQDAQFTQFYAAPLYHNPAFAGAAHRGRGILNYRNQWPAIPGAFVTYAASVDNYFKKYNSGAGISMSVDRAGSGNLMSYSIGGQYAYELALSKKWAFRPGFELSWKGRSIDYYRLVWRDQLNPNGPNGGSTGDPTRNSITNPGFFDVSLGGLFYSKAIWAGMSAMHANQPNQSITGENSKLPVRYTFMAGGNIRLSNKRAGRFNNNEAVTSITPAMIYKMQGTFQQLDMGAYLNVDPIVVGMWYRGIPILKNAGNTVNQDALAILVGLKSHNYSFGYSYDLTISSLGPGTAGSHELSLSYEFDTGKSSRRRHTAIPCPKF